ncbi:MAG: glutamate ABC transporter substrate-binding protein [Micrococcales bacterium]|nr:glutamate ABC transporter substrate-binding protein [Micrococcales bacterium]
MPDAGGNRRRGRLAAAVAALAAYLLVVSACTTPGQDAAGTLRIGVTTSQPGLSQRTGEEFAGFDIDVGRRIAAALDRTPVFVATVASQRENLLTTSQADIVVAAFSMTPERAQRVAFAGPYLVTGQDVLVRAGEPPISGRTDLPGHTVCVVRGSTASAQIRRTTGGVLLRELDTSGECIEALTERKVDAVSDDAAILAGYAALPRLRDRVRLVNEPYTVERYGVALPRGDRDRCERVRTAITDMIESGEWAESLRRHFGAGTPLAEHEPPAPDTCA